MVVRLYKSQLDYFRRKARNNPNEIYAVLVGRHASKSELEIHYFIHPKAHDYEKATPTEVTVSADFLIECEEDAREHSLKVVGSIHSHPNWPPILSPTDHAGHIESGDRVSGVVEVTKGRTRVAFWRHDSSLRCTIKYWSPK